MTEFAPRRRRHSSVGLLQGDQGPKLSDLAGGLLGPSLYLYDQGPKAPSSGPRAPDNSGRKPERVANNSKVRTVTDSKIMVLGMAGVGKSALVVRFLTNRFIWEYDPTLESTYKHATNVDEESVVMEILDTAGQEETIHREGSVRWADGYVLVYAINDRTSFQGIVPIKQYLDDVKKTNVQCVLVANKKDLLHERKVESSEGEALAQEMACAFYETSASDGGSDITELFHELHREIRRRKMMESKGRRRSSAQQVRSVFNRVLNKIGSTS